MSGRRQGLAQVLDGGWRSALRERPMVRRTGDAMEGDSDTSPQRRANAGIGERMGMLWLHAARDGSLAISGGGNVGR